MRKQFVNTIENLMPENDNLTLLLGDIGIFGFKNCFEKYPNRTFNIGILEQSTISLSAGLSNVDLIPVVHTIAPFLVERSLEQLKVDFGYQSLNGNFVTIGYSYDYAGLGATHHCPGDVQQLLTIPNMEIVLPGTSKEFDSLFKQSYTDGKPTYFRLSEYENTITNDVVFGKGNIIKKGKNATIICVGNLLDNVLSATIDMDVTILYYTTINPFDSDLLLENFNENIILIEPYYEGGLNYKINKTLSNKKYKLNNIGVPHSFLTNYGSKLEHDKNLNLDSEGIRKKLKLCLS
jgi:transketolase